MNEDDGKSVYDLKEGDVYRVGPAPKMPKAIYLKVDPWWKSWWMVLGARVRLRWLRGMLSKEYVGCIVFGFEWYRHDGYRKYERWQLAVTVGNLNLTIQRRRPSKVYFGMPGEL